MRFFRLGTLALALLVAACTPVGERTQLSVGYYSIRGKTFAELDQQIALHGPAVTGVGRALAATNIRMVPDFRFASQHGQCVVESATVRVQAHVTLPKLASQGPLRASMKKSWSNLEQYAREHEAVHVAIADKYALRAEKMVKALPPEPQCETLRANAVLTFRKLMAEHEQEQIQFDADERERIARLVARSRRGEFAREVN